MIKFYRGNWADLSGRATDTSDHNSICFIQDRQVLMMGGQEYGKDVGVVKTVLATNGGLSRTDKQPVASGTLFAFQGDQSLWMYAGDATGGQTGSWERIMDPTLSSANVIVSGSNYDAVNLTGNGVTIYDARATVAASGDMYQATLADVTKVADNIEGKISAAYGNGDVPTVDPVVSSVNKVVVSKINGIAKTEYILNQDRSLITVKTDGKGARSVAGTSTDNILVTETTLSEQTNDILENGLEIRKFQTAEAGFRASYGLFNRQTGSQLGDTINIIKDQFLRGAEYVAAYTADNTSFIDWPAGAAKPTGIPANITDRAQLNRYLKLTFALPATKNGEGSTSGNIEPDSSDTSYASEADTTIYINVNELFDSYTGVSGVAVNQDTNEISGVVDPSTELGLPLSTTRGQHYNKVVDNGDGTSSVVGKALLTVNGAGFNVSGVKQEITAYIQDISGITAKGVASNTAAATTYHNNASYPVFLTEVGIGTDGTLTGAASGINAEGIYYNGHPTDITIAAGSVGAAISAIADHIGGLDYSFNGDSEGPTPSVTRAVNDTYFIYAISEVNGQIATSAKPINAANLKADAFTTAELSGTNATALGLHLSGTGKQIYLGNAAGTGQVQLQDALTSLAQSTHDAISAMDMDLVGRVAGDLLQGGTNSATAPSGNASTAESNRVINTIKQSDGKVFATYIDLVDENILFAPIAEAAGSATDKIGNTTVPYASARVAVDGYNVEAALNSISNTIAKLDFTDAGAGVAPAINTTNKYSIVNTVAQADGLISETKIELTDANTFVSAIDGVLPGVGTNSNQTKIAAANARVAINSNTTSAIDNSTEAIVGGSGHNGSLATALTNISNLIADYCSFHDKDGFVI